MTEPSRLLVVKLADFGDALLTTPALRALRQRYPGARIDALTTPQSEAVFRHSGFADDVIAFRKESYDRPLGLAAAPLAPLRLGRRLRSRRYDAVALFHPLTTRAGSVKHAALALSTGAPIRAGLAVHGAGRAWFLNRRAPDGGFDADHTVRACLAVASALDAPPPADLSLSFRPGREAFDRARELLAGLPSGGGPVVALHPGCGGFSPARRWSATGFAAVADGLADRGCRLVLVGTPADDTAAVAAAARAPMLDLTGRTDLPVLAAVLSAADVFVGNDSGVTHLATAMDTAAVAVFGPSNPVAWGPWWPGAEGRNGVSPHQVVALDLPCRPCLYVGHSLGSPHGCPTRDCLAWLAPERVLAAAIVALEGRSVPAASANVLPFPRDTG